MKNFVVVAAAVVGLAACSTSGTDAGGSAGSAGTGGGLSDLINVNLSDIRAEIAKNVDVALERVPITIQLPVTVAANVCGVNVNLLSVQVDTGNNTCTATTSSVELEQAVKNQVG
jgi:hypothetical protein